MELIKKISKTLSDLAFPSTCVCCGTSTNSGDQHICSLCRFKRFEYAGNSEDVILPNSVLLLYRMWYFDKGGYLQELLHQLKYNYMRGIGIELGYLLGENLIKYMKNGVLDEIDPRNPIIVPVPLHRSKKRKRGYNQARALAQGVAKSTGWEVLDRGIIERIRKTKTQTGLNMIQRSKNLAGAFQVRKSEVLLERFAIIVDDVFTTGATTFELAKTIHGVSNGRTAILTVARA